MALEVDPSIWDQFPGMLLVVAYAEGIDNSQPSPELAAEIAALHARTKQDWSYENAQSHPSVAAWRTTMRDAMGLSSRDYPSSVEAIAKRVVAGKGVASINPLVDFYNMVSVANLVPVGGWDTDDLSGGNIVLRHTRAGDTFQVLGSSVREDVPAGEVCYADAEELVTRHFIWRQSDKAKVGPETASVFLVSEILAEVGEEVAEQVRESFADGLRTYFGATAVTDVLAAGSDDWDWALAGRSGSEGGV